MLRRLPPYLLLVAALAALGASLWRPDAVAVRLGLSERLEARQRYYLRDQLLGHHRRVDAATAAGATLFFGSSTIQGLNASNVRPCHANFGIGGEDSGGLAARIGGYRSPRRAAAIVISTGLNDVLRGADAAIAPNYASILAALPPEPVLILSSLPRLPERRGHAAAIRRANEIVRQACMRRARCRYVDLHGAMSTPDRLVEADGVHLNAEGYALWARLFREALAAEGVAPAACPSVAAR